MVYFGEITAIFYLCTVGEAGIEITLCVGLSVCGSVCLSVCKITHEWIDGCFGVDPFPDVDTGSINWLTTAHNKKTSTADCGRPILVHWLGLQEVCISVVQHCCSYGALCSKQHAFLGGDAVFLQLLNAPLQLRCPDRPLHNLAHSCAGIIKLLMVWLQIVADVCCHDVCVKTSVGWVTQDDVARW